MSRKSMQRLRSALMGYSSLDPPMELWPDARWGKLTTKNTKKIVITNICTYVE